MRSAFRTTALLTLLVLPSTAAPAEPGSAADNDRAIQANDRLTISIDGLDGPDRATVFKPVVDEKGQVKLPYLKQRLTAKGLTRKQLQAAIDKAYRDSGLVEAANSSVGVVPSKPGEKPRVVRPKDRLTIAIRDLKAPGKETIIKATADEKGHISLPYVGPIAAGDLTGDELEDAIIKAYRDAALIQEAVVKVTFAPEQKP
jgi:protein involved in polysaccharide export with SLBB domain